MGFLFYIFIFLFGLAAGSFLNVLIYRLPQEKSIRGRSHCLKCGHQLAWQDLVPVLSFLILGGRCRYCGKKISLQYPIVEIATGLLFLLIFNFQFLSFDLAQDKILNQFLNFQLSNFIQIIFLWFIVGCLIVIFVSDLKYFIIPDEIIIVGVIGIFLYRFFSVLNFNIWNLIRISNLEFRIFQPLWTGLLAAFAASAFFMLIVFITKGKGMGMGDAKLAFLMGLVLGWPKILPALLLAFVSGALVGLGLILAGKAKMKSEIPFGTFLAASTFLIMLLGEKILIRYINLII